MPFIFGSRGHLKLRRPRAPHLLSASDASTLAYTTHGQPTMCAIHLAFLTSLPLGVRAYSSMHCICGFCWRHRMGFGEAELTLRTAFGKVPSMAEVR